VLQYREGDKVCERCGLIADERMISEEAEYRFDLRGDKGERGARGEARERK
jgi:transcription initiation factor TFIIIB Brf1 subunit/transcription initiation factor TFIIB